MSDLVIENDKNESITLNVENVEEENEILDTQEKREDVSEEEEDDESEGSYSGESTYANESTFDEFNFSSDEEDDEDDESLSLDSDDEDDEDTDYEDAEFNFDDVKQSIEYVQDRYNFFKKSVVRDCSLYLLYVENNNIVHVEKSIFDLEEDGSVKKDKIVELLQEKRLSSDKKYFIKELWQYNYNLNPELMINMFDEDESFTDIDNMMKSLTRLSDIRFEDSIDIFKDKNSLFVLYTLDKPMRQSTNKRKSLKKGRKGKSSRKTQRK